MGHREQKDRNASRIWRTVVATSRPIGRGFVLA
jgi:hypothetical protein